MGGYYAAESGEVAEISHAIAEHYRPQGPSDRIPQTPIGLCVSLADKLDTLVGFFGIGQKPTGSRDPFGLRRAALGIIAMIDEAELNIPLAVLCEKAAQLHGLDLTNAELDLFIIERLRGRLRDKGYAHDVIAAILAGPDGARKIDDLLQTCRLVDALSQFVDSDKGQQLISGWRRVSSILEAEEKNTEISMHIDESLFADKAEKGLYQALQNMPETDLSDRKQMEQTMRNLASLSEPINQFFDNVIVNSAENSVRENRLAMLAQIRKTMRGIADFGQLEG